MYAPDIEHALLKHPSISRAFVLGVPDLQAGQRVATLIEMEDDQEGYSDVRSSSQLCNGNLAKSGPDDGSGHRLGLSDLRRWLAVEQGLPLYKLPTLMRLLGRKEALPVTISGKPMKSKIQEEFFDQVDLANGRVEVWYFNRKDADIGERAWDWAGIGTH
jgi:malonyl-CoA/methylmalonyl-CoA synthetase